MLTSSHIALIKKIIFSKLDPEVYSAFIFGSRASGEAARFSDIDIGIEGKDELSSIAKVELEEAFEESDLPYSVDVVDFSIVRENFKTVAKQRVIPL